MAWKVTVQPTVEPLELDEVKQHLKVTYTNEDTLITAMIQAARQEVESYCGINLLSQTIEESFDCFPGTEYHNPFGNLWLSRSPLISVTSISYQDTDNATQTLESTKYAIDTKAMPGCISPEYNETWPSTVFVKNAVTVTYTVGYGTTAADVPATIKQAMLLMIGDWYENREDSPHMRVGNAEFLLNKHRVIEFV